MLCWICSIMLSLEFVEAKKQLLLPEWQVLRFANSCGGPWYNVQWVNCMITMKLRTFLTLKGLFPSLHQTAMSCSQASISPPGSNQWNPESRSRSCRMGNVPCPCACSLGRGNCTAGVLGWLDAWWVTLTVHHQGKSQKSSLATTSYVPWTPSSAS